MTIRNTAWLHRFVFSFRLIASSVAIAAVATVFTAPAGNAIPESTIISECDSAGGTYTTTVVEGKRYSKCCYRDINGVKHCDNYLDGTYTTTDGALELPPTPPPPPPAGEVVAPPATAATRAPEPGMTLYLPPPVDPVAPLPSQVIRAP